MDDTTNLEKVEKKPVHGGKRAGSGRKPRGPGKVPYDVKIAARVYTQKAIETLAAIMTDSEAPHAARAAASNALLDRGYGKPSTVIEGTGDGGSIVLQVLTGVPRGADDGTPGD